MAISSRALIVAMALCLAACKPAQSPESTPAATDSESTAVSPSPERSAPATAPANVVLPPVAASDDPFIGWYSEQGGVGLLQACGQAVPLPIVDPTFLRELRGKLGRSEASKPVYVQLRVRLGSGSRLEVTQVQQFGADETPITNCALVQSAS